MNLLALRPWIRVVGISLLSLGVSDPLLVTFGSPPKTAAQQEKTSAPWSDADVLRAADLLHELNNSKRANAPTVLYVGFRTLLEGGHVPGAVFHGTASNEKGMEELKQWLEGLPRDTNLVVYCGCCPFDHCPNVRPAYKALREMGFTRVRVLVLPTSFAADWVEKGYPMEKGHP